MAIEHLPFDPNDPFDVACEAVRKALTQHIADCMRLPEMAGLSDPKDIMIASLTGAMMGVAGLAIASVESNDESHLAMRKAVIEMVPFCFDQARGCMQLPPLPEVH